MQDRGELLYGANYYERWPMNPRLGVAKDRQLQPRAREEFVTAYRLAAHGSREVLYCNFSEL